MRRLALVTLMFVSLALTLSTLSVAQSGKVIKIHSLPQLTVQNSDTANGLISVSPVNARVVWAAGRNGTFTKTIDGGKTWHHGVVAGAETLQFRDVQGVSERVAYLMSIGNGTDSRIYKTEDGGRTWTLQFQNQDPNAFYDCFAFWGPKNGIAQSDSVNGRFPTLRTRDGENWEDIGDRLPMAQPGEAQFASSGTCVATQVGHRAWIGTGGSAEARILATIDGGYTWASYNTPITHGTASSGIFSVSFRSKRHGFICGGELDPTLPNEHRCARSGDGGQTWQLTTEPPAIGTIYGLSYAREADFGNDSDAKQFGPDNDDGTQAVIITGPGGTAFTADEGYSWSTINGMTGFWAVAFANGNTGWAVGVNGEITRIDF